MPNLVSLPTLTLALASLIAIGEPHKSVEIDLRGGEGAQRIVGSQGDFGSKPPVADGVLLSAAPGDLIRVNVNGPTSFTGKTLHMNAEVVKITTHKEGGFFGFFQRTVKTRKTTRKSTQETKTLSIGSEIQIMLEINYKDGSPGLTVAMPTAGYKLRKAADVRLKIEYDRSSVAWSDRTTLQADERQSVDTWMVALRKLGFDEVYEKETGVTKGNLEGLTIVVKSERPGQFNRYQ